MELTPTIAIVAIILMVAWFYYDIKKLNKEFEDKDKSSKTYMFDVEIFLSNGELFLKQENVTITHWSGDIYILRDRDGNYIKKVHKGRNMMLVQSNKREINEQQS